MPKILTHTKMISTFSSIAPKIPSVIWMFSYAHGSANTLQGKVHGNQSNKFHCSRILYEEKNQQPQAFSSKVTNTTFGTIRD